MKVSVFIFTLLAVTVSVDALTWGYEEYGANWATDIPENCAEQAQSPIQITTENVETNYSLGLFDRSDFYTPPTSMVLVNNGHALQMTITGGAPTISDSKVLPFDAELAQYHFHWGATKDEKGSEHSINGKREYGELHFVYFNKKYADLGAAASQPDGLAVLGFLISAGYPQDNEMLDQIFDLLDQVEFKGNSTTPPVMFSVETLLPPKMDMYYRYKGSLTTPTCDESVLWTVFADYIEISPAQAEKLSSLLYSGYDNSTAKIGGNYREVQELNGRAVTAPAPLVQESSALGIRPSLMVGLIASLLAFFL